MEVHSATFKHYSQNSLKLYYQLSSFLQEQFNKSNTKIFRHYQTYACNLKIFVVMDKEQSINALISFGICFTPKESK